MTPQAASNSYKYHRFPGEIISHAVWLYYRFSLSHRNVEELLFVRGIIVSYEAIRKWCRKFGQLYANQLRRRRPRPGDKWHLDEVFLTIHGERHYRWHAVDQDGNILDILVQSRRNTKAAKKFFRKLLKGLTYIPRVIITDKLKSYGAAKREILLGSSTASTGISTTGLRTRISPHAGAELTAETVRAWQWELTEVERRIGPRFPRWDARWRAGAYLRGLAQPGGAEKRLATGRSQWR
jgi:transposase-like protein